MTDENYTRWAVIGAGEGGGRIAAGYLTRDETSGGRAVRSVDRNPSIEDRILILNTNRSDIRNIVNDVSGSVDSIEPRTSSPSSGGIEAVDNVLSEETTDDEDRSPSDDPRDRTVSEEYMDEFGPLDGVGNDFERGEYCTQEGFGRIENRIRSKRIYEAQALLYYTTLGGGTGNGSVPYIIRQLKHAAPIEQLDNPNTGHIAFGVWPYDHNGPQQHFNAVCGLSRLLTWYDGKQNADMVLLASNSHVSEIFDIDQTDADRHERQERHEQINDWIRTAVDMIIAAGRDASRVIDSQDYIRQPSNHDAYYFSPGLTSDRTDLLDLEVLLDDAADRTYVPMDPTTSEAVYVVVRVPESDFETGVYTQQELSETVDWWLRQNGYDQVRHRMQAVVPHESHRDTIDVLTLFGGFDLKQLLGRSLEEFETHYCTTVNREDPDETQQLTSDQYRSIKTNLESFLDHEL